MSLLLFTRVLSQLSQSSCIGLSAVATVYWHPGLPGLLQELAHRLGGSSCHDSSDAGFLQICLYISVQASFSCRDSLGARFLHQPRQLVHWPASLRCLDTFSPNFPPRQLRCKPLAAAAWCRHSCSSSGLGRSASPPQRRQSGPFTITTY